LVPTLGTEYAVVNTIIIFRGECARKPHFLAVSGSTSYPYDRSLPNFLSFKQLSMKSIAEQKAQKENFEVVKGKLSVPEALRPLSP
jgi:hypothetical protein